jgi:hypothetical protein
MLRVSLVRDLERLNVLCRSTPKTQPRSVLARPVKPTTIVPVSISIFRVLNVQQTLFRKVRQSAQEHEQFRNCGRDRFAELLTAGFVHRTHSDSSGQMPAKLHGAALRATMFRDVWKAIWKKLPKFL